jgi:hypothetical protein
MTKHDIDKSYISPIDTFLYTFDRDHKKSESQIKEIKKHQRIARLRDDPNPSDTKDEIWTGF